MFADLAHYFEFCALIERRWRVRVRLNRKTELVNAKLADWHRKNPDGGVINLAKWRISRARRKTVDRAASQGILGTVR